MSIQILKKNNEIANARAELQRRDWSLVENRLIRTLRTRKWLPGINVGDYVKSWDILNTALFAQKNVHSDGSILDMGAYCSEILPVLHKMGYQSLVGVDLNPDIQQMPFADKIRYEMADFMATPFDDQSFQMITAISVIEHGFDSARLLKELARLLKPGGYFVASFDYWPNKVDTTDQRIFDMSWTIFSKEEIEQFIRSAATYGFYPTGECNWEPGEQTMHFYGKRYTFGWLALRKDKISLCV